MFALYVPYPVKSQKKFFYHKKKDDKEACKKEQEIQIFICLWCKVLKICSPGKKLNVGSSKWILKKISMISQHFCESFRDNNTKVSLQILQNYN